MAIHPCLLNLPKGIQNQLKGMDFEQQAQFVRDNLNSSSHDIRKALLTAKAETRILRHFGATPKDQVEEAILSTFSAKGAVQSGIGSLYGRIKAIENQFHNMFQDAMEQFRPGAFGRRRNVKGERNAIREIFGENTGDDIARGLSQQWKKVANYAMERFNAAGGAITKLTDFNMPMYHDAARIAKVSYEEWYKDIVNKIDISRLAKSVTGSTTMSKKQLDMVMRKIYNKLSTDGMISFDDIGLNKMAKKQVGDYHQEHRVLHFHKGEDWLAYFDKYGSGTPFGAMTSYMEAMSRQIGAMEMLGPNHTQTLAKIKKFADDFSGNPGTLSEKVQHIYDNIMGHTYGPRTTFGDIAQNMRFLSVMGHLGLALPASLADAAFVGANLQMRFGSSSAMKAIGQMFARTATLQTAKTRILANKMMLGADYAMVAARSAARVSEVYGHSLLARGSDATIRASGLNVWTNVGKQVFGIENVLNISAAAGKEFGGLPKPIRMLFDTYGITKKEWDILRKAPMAEYEGARFLDWSKYQFGEEADAVAKMVGAIVEETHIAVPEPSPRVKAMMNQGTKSGTVVGELMRTGGLFKSFPVSAFVSNLARAQTLTGSTRLAYFGSLFAGATMLGTLGIQAKEVLKGNDPYNWNDPTLYGKGFLQGGVLGIVGDFLFNDPNMYGGWASLIGGPVVGDMNEVVNKFMFGTMKDVLTLEEDFMQSALRNGINTTQKIMPGRMWYTRVAIDRAIDVFMDQMNDPVHSKKVIAMRRRMYKEDNRGQWFERGDALPSRLPTAGTEF